MWTRELLKTNAKNCLRQNFWPAMLVCMAYTALADLGTNGNGFRVSVDLDHLDSKVITAALLALLLSAVWRFLFIYPLSVGLARRFMEARTGNPPFSTLFGAFRSGDYKNIVKVMFFQHLYIFLYSLLLVIPGIIRTYEYYLVPYLLAENPQMDDYRARALSKQIMDGEKMNVFVLELSFLGWGILQGLIIAAATTLSLGLLAVPITILSSAALAAYRKATYAELYAALREKAFALGMTSPEELSGFIVY